MDLQGFGNTQASGFFNNTSTSGFGGSMGAGMRPSSSFMHKMSTDGASMTGNANPNLTELGSDDEERRAQLEFEQSMRATNMSFFQTAKSTFMSTTDLLSDKVMTDSQAWGVAVSELAARCEFGAPEPEEDGSDLAGNAN